MRKRCAILNHACLFNDRILLRGTLKQNSDDRREQAWLMLPSDAKTSSSIEVRPFWRRLTASHIPSTSESPRKLTDLAHSNALPCRSAIRDVASASREFSTRATVLTGRWYWRCLRRRSRKRCTTVNEPQPTPQIVNCRWPVSARPGNGVDLAKGAFSSATHARIMPSTATAERDWCTSNWAVREVTHRFPFASRHTNWSLEGQMRKPHPGRH